MSRSDRLIVRVARRFSEWRTVRVTRRRARRLTHEVIVRPSTIRVLPRPVFDWEQDPTLQDDAR